MPNYYQILGVHPTDTMPTIRKHYYRLAKECHPDKHNGDTHKCEEFKRLSEAYSMLSNPRKRYLYDIRYAVQELLGCDDQAMDHHFTDDELDMLYRYYTRVIQSTEYRFMSLLIKGLPSNVMSDMSALLKRVIQGPHTRSTSSPCDTSLTIPTHKTIDCKDLKDDYTIHLKRPFLEVHQNTCKEIVVCASSGYYHIFVTHSDYTICIPTNGSLLTIVIETNCPDHIILNGPDIYYTFPVTLYQQMFDAYVSVSLPDGTRYDTSPKQRTTLEHMGLQGPTDPMIGSLFLIPELVLRMDMQIAHIHRDLLKTIFN